MRMKIELELKGRNRMLPMDYQSHFSAWIYNVLSKADKEYATFLHNEGYGIEQRVFKYFSFMVDLGEYRMWKKRALFELKGNAVSLILSSQVPVVAEIFLEGVFSSEEGFVGDKFSGIEFKVSKIGRLEDVVFKSVMRYKALSPIYVGKQIEGHKMEQHLAPTFLALSSHKQQLFSECFEQNTAEIYDEFYKDCLVNNIKEKVRVYKASFPEEKIVEDEEVKMRVLGRVRKKLLCVKPNQKQMTKNQAYYMEFELEASPDVQELMYYSGFGGLCSSGAGFVEVLRSETV